MRERSSTPPAAKAPGAPATGAGTPSLDEIEPGESKPGESKPGESKPGEIKRTPEIGGPKGPEPTRYGDWERDGRCVDF
jgi:hypothetical protein